MTTETILTPAQVDSLLEGVLRASGSRLGNYTYQKTLDDLHSAIRAIEQAVLQSEQIQAWMPELSDDVTQPSSGPKTLTRQQKQKILDHINKTITDGGAVYHRTIIDLTEWALLSENGFTELTWAEWARQNRHQ